MRIVTLKSGGITGKYVYAPYEINQLEFDLLIISVSIYGEEIKKELIEKHGVAQEKIVIFELMDKGIHWQEERIVTLKKCIAMLKERGISGNMAEVGVYKGDFAKLLNRAFPERKLYLFDTFEGFNAERDIVHNCDLDKFKDTSIDCVLNKMVTPQNCIVKKGYFPDTAEGVEDTFCLVSLDCDLYNPILAGLEYFYPRLEKGGYIFIHDFGSYHYDGVKKAVYEYCKKHNIAIVPIVDRCLSVIISK